LPIHRPNLLPLECPFSKELKESSFAPREAIAEKDARTLAREILAMSDEDVRTASKGSPMKRAKLRGLKRNAAVVLENVGTREDIDALRRNGKLCLLGFPQHQVSIAAVPLVFLQRSLVSSGIGSRLEIRKMLDFTARHGTRPQVELFPMREVNFALERLRNSEVRYRAVLVNE